MFKMELLSCISFASFKRNINRIWVSINLTPRKGIKVKNPGKKNQILERISAPICTDGSKCFQQGGLWENTQRQEWTRGKQVLLLIQMLFC
jgi:hypothetical protein